MNEFEFGMKRWKLGKIGYALFAPKSAWKAGVTVEDVLRSVAVGELLPGGHPQSCPPRATLR